MPNRAVLILAAGLAAAGAGTASAQDKDEGGIGRSLLNVIDRTADGVRETGRTATRAVGSAMEGTGSLIEGVGRRITPGRSAEAAPPAPAPVAYPQPAPVAYPGPAPLAYPEQAPVAYPAEARPYPAEPIPAPAITYPADPGIAAETAAVPGAPAEAAPLPQPRPGEAAVAVAAVDPAAAIEDGPDTTALAVERAASGDDSVRLSDFIADEATRMQPQEGTADEAATSGASAAAPLDGKAEAAKPARVVYEASSEAASGVKLASLDRNGDAAPVLLREPERGGGMPWSWLAFAALALGGIHVMRRSQGAGSTSLGALLSRFRPRPG